MHGHFAGTLIERFHWVTSRVFPIPAPLSSEHSDLDEALALGRNTLEYRPQGHPDRARSLGSVASYLHARSKHPTYA